PMVARCSSLAFAGLKACAPPIFYYLFSPYPGAGPAIEGPDAARRRRRQWGQDDSALSRSLPAPALEQRQLTVLGRSDRAAAQTPARRERQRIDDDDRRRQPQAPQPRDQAFGFEPR